MTFYLKPLLASISLTFDGWNGRGIAMEQRFIDTLIFYRLCTNRLPEQSGAHGGFYVAWYQSQSKGESIHSLRKPACGGGGHPAIPLDRTCPAMRPCGSTAHCWTRTASGCSRISGFRQRAVPDQRLGAEATPSGTP